MTIGNKKKVPAPLCAGSPGQDMYNLNYYFNKDRARKRDY